MKKCAALPSEAALPQVLALWIDLQARLMLVLDEVSASKLKAELRAQGVRQLGTVANNLAKELKCAKAMAESMGIVVTDEALSLRTNELTRGLSYQCNLRELQRTYEALMMESAPSKDAAEWIKCRMRIHEFQLQQFGLH
jgi:hypothetical protein